MGAGPAVGVGVGVTGAVAVPEEASVEDVPFPPHAVKINAIAVAVEARRFISNAPALRLTGENQALQHCLGWLSGSSAVHWR